VRESILCLSGSLWVICVQYFFMFKHITVVSSALRSTVLIFVTDCYVLLRIVDTCTSFCAWIVQVVQPYKIRLSSSRLTNWIEFNEVYY